MVRRDCYMASIDLTDANYTISVFNLRDSNISIRVCQIALPLPLEYLPSF